MSWSPKPIDSRRIEAMNPNVVSGPGSERVPMRMRGWRALLPALFLAGTTALLLEGCGRKTETHTEDPPPVTVSAVTVTPTTLPDIVEGVGSLRSAREAQLASKVMGSVIEIRKRAGDRVRQGEVVVVIDSQDVIGQSVHAVGCDAPGLVA